MLCLRNILPFVNIYDEYLIVFFVYGFKYFFSISKKNKADILSKQKCHIRRSIFFYLNVLKSSKRGSFSVELVEHRQVIG